MNTASEDGFYWLKYNTNLYWSGSFRVPGCWETGERLVELTDL
jgi:hypothetical protein